MALRIRKGDLVQVITGADRGKQGKVLAIDAQTARLRVERVRLQKRHVKPGRQGNRTGGIVEQEGFIDASNVMLVDPTRGKPGRVRVQLQDGRRVRTFTRGGAAVPEPATR